MFRHPSAIFRELLMSSSLLYLIRRLLHVSTSMCHLQGASYVLITLLFDTQAATCFDIHVPSSGSFLCPHEGIRSSLKMAHGCWNM
jgi:hypothetical protein